jgi:uncharacterized protein with HEPN domain
MIEAVDQAVALVHGVGVNDLAADRIRREALLWNFTILGEASTQLSVELKQQFTDVAWRQPARLRNRIVHGYWSITWTSCMPPPRSSCLDSAPTSSACSRQFPRRIATGLVDA